jgi:SAM-dependent methyltransferase
MSAGSSRTFYDDYYEQMGREERRWRKLSARIKAGNVAALVAPASINSILEIGCGDGALLRAMAERGIARLYWGTEISGIAAARARAQPIPAPGEVLVAESASLPFPDGCFDLAVLSHVVEHLQDPAAAIHEAGRVARRVFIEVPLERTWVRLLKLAVRGRLTDPDIHDSGHIQLLDRLRLRRLVADAGLTVERERLFVKPDHVHFYSRDGRIRGAAAGRVAVKLALRKVLRRIGFALYLKLFIEHYGVLCHRASASHCG